MAAESARLGVQLQGDSMAAAPSPSASCTTGVRPILRFPCVRETPATLIPPPAIVPTTDRANRSAPLQVEGPPTRAAPNVEPRTLPTPNPLATPGTSQLRSKNTPPQALGSEPTMPPNPPIAPPTIEESVRSTVWPATVRGAITIASNKQRRAGRGVMEPEKRALSARGSSAYAAILTKSFAPSFKIDFDLNRIFRADFLNRFRS